jgi:hypothetical protein
LAGAWAQGLFERIVEVHVQARYEDMIAKNEGKPALPPGVADKGYMSICLPPDTRTPDLIRVIVTGLHGLPRELQTEKWPGERGSEKSLSLSRSDVGGREALGCETLARVQATRHFFAFALSNGLRTLSVRLQAQRKFAITA